MALLTALIAAILIWYAMFLNKDFCCAAHQRTIALYGFYRIIEKENYHRVPGRDI